MFAASGTANTFSVAKTQVRGPCNGLSSLAFASETMRLDNVRSWLQADAEKQGSRITPLGPDGI